MAGRSRDLPAEGPANSSADKLDAGGALVQRRYYGPDGWAVKNFDYGHDHGAGDPHAHDWDWSKTPTPSARPGPATRRVSMVTADYMSGWLDTNIHEFLGRLRSPGRSMAYALITYLDSNPEPAYSLAHSKHLAPLKSVGEMSCGGILVPTGALLAADRTARLFFGFDEVWFLSAPPATPKPGDVVITGPGRIAADQLPAIAGWMRRNKCPLGLGDGTGMNYCLKVRGTARNFVEAMSLSAAVVQP